MGFSLVSLRSFLVVAVLAVITGAAFLGLYCFRSVEYDNPALGLITFHYRFCVIRGVTLDKDRDGILDANCTVLGSTEPSTAINVTECWESMDLDGTMNLHFFYRGERAERSLVLELDLDKDGTFEEHYLGEAAEDRLSNLERPHRTLPQPNAGRP